MEISDEIAKILQALDKYVNRADIVLATDVSLKMKGRISNQTFHVHKFLVDRNGNIYADVYYVSGRIWTRKKCMFLPISYTEMIIGTPFSIDLFFELAVNESFRRRVKSWVRKLPMRLRWSALQAIEAFDDTKIKGPETLEDVFPALAKALHILFEIMIINSMAVR